MHRNSRKFTDKNRKWAFRYFQEKQWIKTQKLTDKIFLLKSGNLGVPDADVQIHDGWKKWIKVWHTPRAFKKRSPTIPVVMVGGSNRSLVYYSFFLLFYSNAITVGQGGPRGMGFFLFLNACRLGSPRPAGGWYASNFKTHSENSTPRKSFTGSQFLLNTELFILTPFSGWPFRVDLPLKGSLLEVTQIEEIKLSIGSPLSPHQGRYYGP